MSEENESPYQTMLTELRNRQTALLKVGTLLSAVAEDCTALDINLAELEGLLDEKLAEAEKIMPANFVFLGGDFDSDPPWLTDPTGRVKFGQVEIGRLPWHVYAVWTGKIVELWYSCLSEEEQEGQ